MARLRDPCFHLVILACQVSSFSISYIKAMDDDKLKKPVLFLDQCGVLYYEEFSSLSNFFIAGALDLFFFFLRFTRCCNERDILVLVCFSCICRQSLSYFFPCVHRSISIVYLRTLCTYVYMLYASIVIVALCYRTALYGIHLVCTWCVITPGGTRFCLVYIAYCKHTGK